MNIIEDTKQKKGKHKWKNDYWKEHGDTVVRCAVPVGDYILAPEVSVDTKHGIQEVAQNLCGKASEKERMSKAGERAQELGTKLVYLIEQEGIKTKADLLPLSIVLPSNQMVLGEQLKRAMEIYEHKYGAEFRFCEPNEAGRVIKEILKNGGKEKC